VLNAEELVGRRGWREGRGACTAGSAKGFEVASALENPLGGECPTAKRDKDVH